jgi:PTH1 family peptidyl-tRNA hydrolase
MIYVIGLGNPGNQYRETRHNIGFWVVDALAEKHRISWKSGNGDYLHGKHSSGKFAVAKPMTYMNNSGLAVQQLLQHEDTNLNEMLIVYDDLDYRWEKCGFDQMAEPELIVAYNPSSG